VREERGYDGDRKGYGGRGRKLGKAYEKDELY